MVGARRRTGAPSFCLCAGEALKARAPGPPARLRRDHAKLLTCIEVIALLYQCQRERTAAWGGARLPGGL